LVEQTEETYHDAIDDRLGRMADEDLGPDDLCSESSHEEDSDATVAYEEEEDADATVAYEEDSLSSDSEEDGLPVRRSARERRPPNTYTYEKLGNPSIKSISPFHQLVPAYIDPVRRVILYCKAFHNLNDFCVAVPHLGVPKKAEPTKLNPFAPVFVSKLEAGLISMSLQN
jgi:hypothetical protein